MRQDISNNIPLLTLSGATGTSADTTAMTFPSSSTGFDTLDYSAVNVIIQAGTLADVDATFAVELQESDATNGTYTAIADADLSALETTVAFIFSEDNKMKQISAKPRKRFLRAVITPAANSGASSFWVGVQGIKNLIGTTA